MLCRVNVQQADISCLFFSIMLHLPRVKFGFLNMEIFLGCSKHSCGYFWTVIPYIVEFIFKELLFHVCFSQWCI